jgi:hypothetical protein
MVAVVWCMCVVVVVVVVGVYAWVEGALAQYEGTHNSHKPTVCMEAWRGKGLKGA